MHALAKIDKNTLHALLVLHERYLQRHANGKRLSLKFTNLNGFDLSNTNFSDADLTGCSFENANLSDVNFNGAILTLCNFRGAKLCRANLENTNLRGSNMVGTDLTMANLMNSDLRDEQSIEYNPNGQINKENSQNRPVDATGAIFNGANLKHSNMGNIAASSASFKYAEMKEVHFGQAHLKNCDFTGANLAGADLNGAKLEGAIFFDTILTGTNFGTHLPLKENLFGALFSPKPIDIHETQILEKKLFDHQIWRETHGIKGRPVDFTNMDLRPISALFKNRQLTALKAENAIATGIVFIESHLQGANFINADLRGANFVNTDLRGANFHKARLIKTDFRNANLGPLKLANGAMLMSNFTDADIRYAIFDDAILLGANFDNAKRDFASFKDANILGNNSNKKPLIV